MKKLMLIIVGLVLFLSGCTKSTFENSVHGLTVSEVDEILVNEIDTINVIIIDDYLYIIEDDRVKSILTPINESSIKPMPTFFFILIMVFAFLLGGVSASNN